MHIHSFPPIESDNSSILILGTVPSKASLQAQQYYAHPRNAFWKIISEILGVNAVHPYEARTASIVAARIALWDVLKSCTREGSLDSNIKNDTIILNDIASFFNNHSHIHRVCFNGAKAEKSVYETCTTISSHLLGYRIYSPAFNQPCECCNFV